MNYDEFERQLLKIVFEEKKGGLTPSFLAYKMQLPHTEVKEHLDRALEQGVVEIETGDDGKLIYTIPGFDPSVAPSEPMALPKRLRSGGSAGESYEKGGGVSSSRELVAVGQSLSSGASSNSREAAASYPRQGDNFDEEARREVDSIAPIGSLRNTTPNLPAVVDDAKKSDSFPMMFSNIDIYTRKVRLFGNYREEEVEEIMKSLLEILNFEHSPSESRTKGVDIYRRGSVAFIIMLLPLIALIFPMLILGAMHMMGKPTLRYEPIRLEVSKLPFPRGEGWEITLNFYGEHGVRFTQPDCQLLNKEIDFLQAQLDTYS